MAKFYWSNKTPTAPAGGRNVTFQSDGGSPEKRSAYVGPAAPGVYGVIPLENSGDHTKVLCGDGAWRVPPGGGGSGGVPSVEDHIHTFTLFDDFIEGYALASSRYSRLGYYVSSADIEYPEPSKTPGRVGVVALNKRTSTSQAVLAGTHGAPYIPGAGAIVWECALSVDRDLSQVGYDNALVLRAGFTDVKFGSPTNAIEFELYKNNNPDRCGRWMGKCLNSGSAQLTAGYYVPAQNEWVRLKFVVSAAGDSVDFYVNGSLIGTVSQNVPTIGLADFFQIWTVAGFTNPLETRLLLDWMYIRITPSRTF